MVCDQSSLEKRDVEARFVELLTYYQRNLLAYISSIMLGDSNSRDVLQDTNVALWSHRDEYDESRPFFPWACGFAYHRVLAYRQSRRRSRLLFNDEMMQEISEAYLKEAAAGDAQLTALKTCLQKLDQKQQKLIHDRYIENISIASIAAQIGGTANQISARLYRIRKALAECIHKVMALEMK